MLRDEDRLAWFLDPAVTGLGGPAPANREQLLIHPAGSLYDRPSARTRVPNFFLAGDYVRTGMNLASMEGANEAARHAVNALLDADASAAARCTTWSHTSRRSWSRSSGSTRHASGWACPTPSTWADARRRPGRSRASPYPE
ncbi:FAD-dependent oxidoreductase [Streptomyces sp. NPDC000880]